MSGTDNIAAAVAEAAGFVQATWQQAVMGSQTVSGMRPIKLNISLRKIYADSIVSGKMIRGADSMSQTIVATAAIAKKLEDGCGPFDMKPALLGGPKARIGKNGRYNIIPFRHGTSDGSGENSNFKTMPKDIYQQARQLKATIKAAAKMQYGGRLTGTEQHYPAGKNPTSGYQHKAGRFEGMVRIEKTYAKATQSKYMTFRVVSDKSDPNSWIHPGYQAHNIVKAVTQFCRGPVEQMIQAAAVADMRKVIASLGSV